MTALDLVRFSASAFRGHRLRASLTVLGVAIGVSAVIVLTSLGEGARRYVINEFASLGSNLLIIIPGKTETSGMAPVVGGAPNDLTIEDAEFLRRNIHDIRAVTPIILGSAAARFGERSRDITVVGTSSGMQKTHGLTMQGGQFLPVADFSYKAGVCVIGWKVKEELFPDVNPLGEFLRLGGFRYRIIGVVAPRGTMLGVDIDDMVEVPAANAMQIFDRRGLFRVLVEVNSLDRIPGTIDSLRDRLTERHNNEEDFTIFTQEALLSTFEKVLLVLTLALSAIAAISLSVAGIGIMNIMLVSVSERTGEVGLLKAIGATKRQIAAAFLAEAALLSSAGGAVGLGFGFAAVRFLRWYFPDYPVAPPFWAVAAAIVVSSIVGLLFGVMPAARAARLDPILALGRRH